VFIFSAMVSGIAAVMLLYMLLTKLRGLRIDTDCVDAVAKYLFYIFIIDFSLEMLDLIHRIYEADESFRSLDFMVHNSLWIPHVIIQILLGTITPIAILGATQVLPLAAAVRKKLYAIAGCLTLVGIFAMRWNVVVGGQLFSKSLLGYTTYDLKLGTREGLATAIVLTVMPLGILYVLAKLLPPWGEEGAGTSRG
jgi:formate-dependent nitrite reductase membrane component NrfD